MKIVLDMNLSPKWIPVLEKLGIEAVHWSTIGSPAAADKVIMEWALNYKYIIFTNDLDFSTLLALTSASGPSVIQIRTQNVSPDHCESLLIKALPMIRNALEKSVIITIDELHSRIRVLPLIT